MQSGAFGISSLQRSITLASVQMPEAARKLGGLVGERKGPAPAASVLAVRGQFKGKDTGIVLYRLGEPFRAMDTLLAEIIMERVEVADREVHPSSSSASLPSGGSPNLKRDTRSSMQSPHHHPPLSPAPARAGSFARTRVSNHSGSSLLSGLDNVSGIGGSSSGLSERGPQRGNNSSSFSSSNVYSNNSSIEDSRKATSSISRHQQRYGEPCRQEELHDHELHQSQESKQSQRDVHGHSISHVVLILHVQYHR